MTKANILLDLCDETILAKRKIVVRQGEKMRRVICGSGRKAVQGICQMQSGEEKETFRFKIGEILMVNEGFRTKDARLIRQDMIKDLNLSILKISGIRALSTYGEESFTIFTEDGGELIINVKIVPHLDSETMKKRISVEIPERGLTTSVKKLADEVLEWARKRDNVTARFRQFDGEPPKQNVRVNTGENDMENKSEQLMSLIHGKYSEDETLDNPIRVTAEYEDGMTIISEIDEEDGIVLHTINNSDATMECYLETEEGLEEIDCDRVGDFFENDMSEAMYKRVIRGGKKIKKLVCGPGRKALNGRCIPLTATEKQHRRAGVRKSKGKRRIAARKTSTLKKRKKSLKKRARLGLSSGKY